jgi:uncharacterized protein YneF (UPF0154 family)
MKILEWITSFIAWLQIVLFPLFFGLIIGFIVYKKFPSTAGFVASILILVLSLLIGIVMATRIWKKGGTTNFIARASASPELNDLDDETKTEE